MCYHGPALDNAQSRTPWQLPRLCNHDSTVVVGCNEIWQAAAAGEEVGASGPNQLAGKRWTGVWYQPKWLALVRQGCIEGPDSRGTCSGLPCVLWRRTTSGSHGKEAIGDWHDQRAMQEFCKAMQGLLKEELVHGCAGAKGNDAGIQCGLLV